MSPDLLVLALRILLTAALVLALLWVAAVLWMSRAWPDPRKGAPLGRVKRRT